MKNNNQNLKQELKNILTSVADAENIKSCEVFPPSESPGNGFMSDFFTGELLNKETGKRTYVAFKKTSPDGFSYSFGNGPLFRTEIIFYTQIFPKLDKFQKEKAIPHPFDNIPRYLAGSVDSDNMFVAMENLKIKGYELFNRTDFLDKQHLAHIFQTYGKFHALSFSFKQQRREDFKNLIEDLVFGFPHIFGANEIASLFKIGYVGAMESLDPVVEADILEKMKSVGDVNTAIRNLVYYKGNYKCLVHGDCWSNNMLFKYKESGELEDIKLLDFQLVYCSTPIHDLSYFFYAGASKEDFDKLDYYLDVYYESFSNFARELGENPAEIFPLAVLKKEWKQYGLMGIFMGCMLWLIKLLDKEEMAKVLGEKGLPKEKYWEKWSELTSEIAKRADFKEKVRNLCLHAVEYGIL